MARTALTAVQLVGDAAVSQGAGATPDATNGNIVVSPGPYHCYLIITNAGGSNQTLLVRGAGYTGTATGAVNSGLPLPAPFTQGAIGDLSITCTASTTQVVELATSDRYTQSDGSLWLDWGASTSLTVYVLTSAYTVV